MSQIVSSSSAYPSSSPNEAAVRLLDAGINDVLDSIAADMLSAAEDRPMPTGRAKEVIALTALADLWMRDVEGFIPSRTRSRQWRETRELIQFGTQLAQQALRATSLL